MNPETSFGASVALVLGEIRRLDELRRSARAKRRSFALDVCLVAHGVRTGHLVDAVCPPNPPETFRALLMTLRRKCVLFRDLALWHHAPTTQSFLVHVPSLRVKIAALLGGSRVGAGCVFVRLDEPPSVSKDPDALRGVLEDMAVAMAQSPDALAHSLSEVYAQDVLVPLAAVVIDYPVAYFPASKMQTSFLERVPLDVYTVSFAWTINPSHASSDEHVLLQFSCPQVLAGDRAELSQGVMIDRLHAKFAAALERIGASVRIARRTETLDRVAL